MTGPVSIEMARVRQRKRDMVEGLIAMHLERYQASGAELIIGTGQFVAANTLEVRLNDGGTRQLAGDRVFLPELDKKLLKILSCTPGIDEQAA